ncbi:MAG: N-acetyl-gamma-glutamyl-phosphate reductase [Candidatus Magasanikbacteria bacterium]|nr:N-acetyl-gamma-glutamyl-phosphate reductase [Candidatus Magasanikbacteria bacterium]
MIQASVVGGSGYAGGELLRILLNHPQIKIKQVTSQKYAGQVVSFAHPNLRARTNLLFSEVGALEQCDLLIFALPNGKSMEIMPKLLPLAPKIIDLGADYRLRDAGVFNTWYNCRHQSPDLTAKFIYGLAELHREQIRRSSYVACGGCEATAIILALYPLVKSGLLADKIIVADVKIGSSAAGNKPSLSTHHAERHGVVRSYRPTHHRHQAEVEQELGVNVEISATAVDLVRGILATIHTWAKNGVTEKDVWRAYREIYQQESFIRVVKAKEGLYRYPEPKILWGTNYCDIGFEKSSDSDRLVVMSAIDNLVKGTAGQAVQAANIMFGFDETLGLDFSGLHPI